MKNNPFEPPEVEIEEVPEDDFKYTFMDKGISVIICFSVGVFIAFISDFITMLLIEKFIYNPLNISSNYIKSLVTVIISGIHIFMGIYYIPKRIYKSVIKEKYL